MDPSAHGGTAQVLPSRCTPPSAMAHASLIIRTFAQTDALSAGPRSLRRLPPNGLVIDIPVLDERARDTLRPEVRRYARACGCSAAGTTFLVASAACVVYSIYLIANDAWISFGRTIVAAMISVPILTLAASVAYTIDYRPPCGVQFGPFPYDDPWWKVLLMILAILLTLAAWASSAADLTDRTDSVVIGTLTRSVVNALTAMPSDPGSINAAVATLNGRRHLTPAVFLLLDPQNGEFFTATPIVAQDGRVDAPGTFLTNAQINDLFQNLADNPSDPAAQVPLRAYKSDARGRVRLLREHRSWGMP
jgi:hypothetical protein